MSGPERRVAAALAVSTLAGLSLAAVYLRGGQPQAEGVLLFISLGGLGAALIVWATQLLPHEQITEDRLPPSSEDDLRAAQDMLARGGREVGRRRFLVRLLLAALGALGIAVLFPIRSLGPRPGRDLFRTAWRPGARLVGENGLPVRADDLDEGSVVTVFPEGHVGSGDSQALLIRVDASTLRLPAERVEWAPGGNIAYSKVCTHAGCPVGLYLAQSQTLLCPCHQSSFDVLAGAVPLFGPATRPLPQLPLEVDADGFLRALGDFPEPVGPAFWDRP